MRRPDLQVVAILLIMAICVISVSAANDPGHDSLYVLRIGDTNITGSINLTGNVTASLVRVNGRFFGDNLDIRADGTSSTAQNFIRATATDLEIGSASKIILNGGGTQVQVGTVSAPADLNVTGTIYQDNTLVCLADGTNCPVIGGASSGGGWTNTSTVVSLATAANNISAGTLFVDNTNGRIGIGTSSAASPLTVNGTIRLVGTAEQTIQGTAATQLTTSSSYLRLQSVNNLIYYNAESGHSFTNGAGSTEWMRLTSAGLGVGIASPSAKLHVNSSTENIIAMTQSTNGPFSWHITTGSGSQYNQGAFVIGRGETAASANKTFEISSNGGSTFMYTTRVFMGTTQGTSRLNINGSVNISGSDATIYVNNTHVCLADGTNCPSTSGASSAAGWQNTSTLVSLVDTADNVTIDTVYFDNTNDRVGLGTSSPQTLLHVNGTLRLGTTNQYTNIYNDGTANTYITSTTGTHFILYNTLDGYGQRYISNGDFTWEDAGASNTVRMKFLSSSGYLGIGISSPSARLHVNGSAIYTGASGDPTYINITTGSANEDAQILFTENGPTSRGFIGTVGAADNNLYLSAGNNLNLILQGSYLTGSGNMVGIGTATPGAKVEINNTLPSDEALILRAAASQTGNLFTIMDSSSNFLFSFYDAGSGAGAMSSQQGLIIAAQDANDVALRVRGNASQTANLQQWQNGSNTTLAYVDVLGNAKFAQNITINDQIIERYSTFLRFPNGIVLGSQNVADTTALLQMSTSSTVNGTVVRAPPSGAVIAYKIVNYSDTTQSYLTIDTNGGINTTSPMYISGSQVCTAGNGLCGASGNISGTGTAGTLAYWTNSTNLGQSILSQSGSTLTVTGNISMPANFFIGSSAIASGTSAIAIGSGAEATNSSTVAIGELSKANRTAAFALGAGTQATGDAATAIGYVAEATNTYATAIGYDALASGANDIAHGHSATATGGSATAIGEGATAAGVGSIAIGTAASATHTTSIALGTYATTTAASQLVIGNLSYPLNTRVFGILNAYELQVNGTTVCRSDGTNCQAVSEDNSSWNESYANTLYYPLGSNPSGYLTSYTETDPLWNGNASLVYLNTNPYNFYNSTTLPYQSNAAGWTNTSTLVYGTSNTTNLSFGNTTGSLPLLFVDATSQRVGIGTSSPGHKLSIVGATHVTDTTSDLTAKYLQLYGSQYNNSHNEWTVVRGTAAAGLNVVEIGGGSASYDAATEIRLYTAAAVNTLGGTQRLTITSAGDTGIGTATPTQKLDINGSINVSGASGTIYIGQRQVCLSDGTNCPSIASSAAGWQNTSTLVSLVDTADNVTIDTIYFDNTNNKVGIGLTPTTYRLEVNGSIGVLGDDINPHILAGDNTTNNVFMRWMSTDYGEIQTQLGGSPAGNLSLQRQGGNVGIGTSAPTQKLDVNGSINVSGPGNIYYQGNLTGYGADLAEFVFGENVEAGDVVIIDPNRDKGVAKTKTPYDTRVAGIVSTDPSHLMSADEGNVPLALAGRVPVKVTDENGSIKRGDLLTTSSTPGFAMKCIDKTLCAGAIVGKAMENLEGETGIITALVVLG